MFGRDRRLLFAHVDVDGGAVEIPVLTYLVLEVAAVGFFDPLGQVTKEDECGYRRAFEHCNVLDLDVLAFVGRWRIGCDDFLHDGVELVGGHLAVAVLVDFDCGLEHLEDALLGEGRGEQDGEVGEGGEALAYGGLIVTNGGH